MSRPARRDSDLTRQAQVLVLEQAEQQLELGPVAMSRAMGVSYDTYKDWRSGRNRFTPVARRCLQLLLMHPDVARSLSDK